MDGEIAQLGEQLGEAYVGSAPDLEAGAHGCSAQRGAVGAFSALGTVICTTVPGMYAHCRR